MTSTQIKPYLGMIVQGTQLGRKSNYKFIWHACARCGRERWVAYGGGSPRSTHCRSCAKVGKHHLQTHKTILPLAVYARPQPCGYIRLLNAIFGERVPPRFRLSTTRVCRYCGRQIARTMGRQNMCTNCYKVWQRTRANNVHPFAASRRQISARLFPVRQTCQVVGCDALGIRHHEDYDKPDDITWLCYKHHSALHYGATLQFKG